MFNKAMVIGRLGKDVVLRYTTSQQAVASFSVATTSKWEDKSGQQQEKTTWHNIVVWGKMGEACNKNLKKGSLVYVEGELDTRSWEDKSGAKKYITEIVAKNIRFLDSRDSSSRSHTGESSGGDFTTEDIPF